MQHLYWYGAYTKLRPWTLGEIHNTLKPAQARLADKWTTYENSRVQQFAQGRRFIRISPKYKHWWHRFASKYVGSGK